MKKKYKHYSIYLNEIESNKKLLSFRCNETNILIWPILRSNFLNLLQSKLFYKEWLNYEKNDSIIIKIIRKLVKLFYLFTNINFYKNIIFKIGKNKILFVKSGYGNIKRKDIIFDRNIDPYLIFAKNNYITFSRSPYKFKNKIYDKKQYYLDYNEQVLDFFSKFDRKNIKISKKISQIVIKDFKKFYKINFTRNEINNLVKVNLVSLNSIPKKFFYYKNLIEKINPKIAIIEGASYSYNALLNYALHQNNCKILEPQHGSISVSYQLSDLLLNNQEYKLYLPDVYLSYGKWWSEQIKLPIEKIEIGSPNRKKIKSNFKSNKQTNNILILSDGLDSDLIIDFAKRLNLLLKKKKRIFLRPHPIEKIKWIHEKIKIKNIHIDYEENIFQSFQRKEIIIGEVSTALFEAIGYIPNIFIWRTPKSIFNIPKHPFTEIKNVEEFADKINNIPNKKNKFQINHIYKKNWKKNFQRYLKNSKYN